MAEKHCNKCGTDKIPSTVPYAVFESAMTRADFLAKRLVWVIVLLIVLLVGSNGAWLWYENQLEVAEETIEEYVIEQDAESGNNNSIINGGDVTNGKAEN